MKEFYDSMGAWLCEEWATIPEAAQPCFQNKDK